MNMLHIDGVCMGLYNYVGLLITSLLYVELSVYALANNMPLLTVGGSVISSVENME